jgi:RNA polymerase sigma factor (TIGR02999 family)
VYVKTDNPGDAQPPELTLLLNQMRHGDREAGERAAFLVYDELHRIAAREMRRERHDHLLQTTALVNEAYLRLSRAKTLELQDRGHFFALASQQMRRILVDYARARNAERRGGGEYALDIDQLQVSANHKGVDILRLDDALNALEKIDPRAAKVIELRYFGGNTDKEVVEALGVSLATVRRDWEFAKSWLFSEISKRK